MNLNNKRASPGCATLFAAVGGRNFFCWTKISNAAPTEQRPDFQAAGGGPKQISSRLAEAYFQPEAAEANFRAFGNVISN